MSSFDELRKRVEAAERQFNAMSRQRRDYGQRLIDMIAMHERNLAESGEQVHVLRQEAAEARALAEERGRALEKARGENEQLRHMLHSLLSAIERNRSNDFEETMLELDRRISSMVAADSDGVARSADNADSAEASQAPEAWTPSSANDADAEEDIDFGAADVEGFGDEDDRADDEPVTAAAAAPEAGTAAEAGGFDDMVAADWPDEQDIAQAAPAGLAGAGAAPAAAAASVPTSDEGTAVEGPAVEDPATAADLTSADDDPAERPLSDAAPTAEDRPGGGRQDEAEELVAAGASPLSLEEVLELAEASAEEQAADALSGIDGDRLTPEDLATLTEMLEESVAAAEEQTADDGGPEDDGGTEGDGGPQDDGARPLNQSSIADITDLIRAEQAAGIAAADDAPATESDGGDAGEDTRFELLDEEELQKGMSADRLFSADDYSDDGFGPVAAAEAEEAGETDDENAFDLSDLDLGGEIDGPPEAESEDGPLEGEAAEQGFEIIDDGEAGDGPHAPDTGTGSGGSNEVTAEEEAELERWRAEVLGRVAQDAQEAAAARQGNQGNQGGRERDGMTRGRAAGGRDSEEEDSALAELDAILAEDDLSYASGSGGEWSATAGAAGSRDGDGGASAPEDAFDVEIDDASAPDLDIPPLEPRGGGLAPALRDKLDADTRAEILARVRQSHGSGRDPGN